MPNFLILELSRNKNEKAMCALAFNMIQTGLEEVIVIKTEMNEIFIEMPRKPHLCYSCHEETLRVYDYWIQRIKHLKMDEHQQQLSIEKADILVRVESDFMKRILMSIVINIIQKSE